MPEVVSVFFGILLAVFVCDAIAIVLAHHFVGFSRVPSGQLADDPRVLLPAQLAAYLIIFGILWRLFQHHHRIEFSRARFLVLACALASVPGWRSLACHGHPTDLALPACAP